MQKIEVEIQKKILVQPTSEAQEKGQAIAGGQETLLLMAVAISRDYKMKTVKRRILTAL